MQPSQQHPQQPPAYTMPQQQMGYPTVMQPMPPVTQIQVQQVPGPQVIVVGTCPACRMGVLQDDYTCLGICLAICFFPIGVLCCLALKQKACPNCGATYE